MPERPRGLGENFSINHEYATQDDKFSFDKETKIYTDSEGQQLVTVPYLMEKYGTSYRVIEKKITEKVPSVEYLKGKQKITLFELGQAESILREFFDLPLVKDEVGFYSDQEGKLWAPAIYFVNKYGVSYSMVNERLKDVKTLLGRDEDNRACDLYDVEVVEKKMESYVRLPRVDKHTRVYVDKDGVEWAPLAYFVAKFPISHTSLQTKIRDIPLINGLDAKGREENLYKVKDLSLTIEEYINLPQVDKESKVYADSSGVKWAQLKSLQRKFGLSHTGLKSKLEGVEKIRGRNSNNGEETDLYRVDQVEKNLKEFLETPQVDKKTNIYVDPEGVQWAPQIYFVDLYKINYVALTPRVSHLRTIKGRDKKNNDIDLFKIDEVLEAIEGFLHPVQVERETGIYTDSEGTQWATQKYFEITFSIKRSWLSVRLTETPFILGKDKAGKVRNLYKINDVVKIFEEYEDQQKETQDRKNLHENLKKITQEILENESELAINFRKILNIFGSSRCLDILYKFRPEFKGLPPDYVKGVLADYLGDFLITKGEFRHRDLEVAVEYLSDVSFQDALYETIKDNCFRYYVEQRRTRKAEEGGEIIYGYLDHLLDQIGHLNSSDLDDIIQKVVIYYDSVLREFHKPERFIDSLNTEREFPDINQRINMKELADKKRLLIADQMGLGKSASAIMAKEQLGAKCALIVAPSNVVETWQRYLSDKRELGGYFRENAAPRVLIVEDSAQAEQAKAEEYDYIIVSQERMNERHTKALKNINFDMMIVDEVHKFKNVKGARSSNLTELTEKIQGDNQYLALLSGTPVPNKVEDLALILKLLYPDKFAGAEDKDLVSNIIRGDVLDLRSLLLPHMQMKDLQEGVEMPELTERITEIELSELEKEIYEVLLEEDEITPSQKMMILRQFLLNPEMIDATPGIESSKLKALEEKLDKAFETQDKIVVFINDYIEGVARGERNILEKLALPEDVEVRVIHGEVDKIDREAIQRELKATVGKVLLVVSGQTADVGVDFSSADGVIFYNEPWTEYQKRQELGRVYRPGLMHDLESDTLIAKGTIEQGMHEYIQKKYQAIEKLLRGIPITDLEKELLTKDEKNKDPDLSVNPELAEYYFSSWDKLMKIFGYVKEIGEEDFKKFLAKYGKDYAGSYIDLGNRSYQANANRVSGTLIHEMVQKAHQVAENIGILDLASGPEMLKRHIKDQYQKRVVSIDMNKEHFMGQKGENRVIGSLTALPFANNSFEYANLSLALHYTNFAPSKGKSERLEVLREMNRVLKPEGKVVINLIYSLDVKDREKFREAVAMLGFKIVEDYTGTAKSGETYTSQVITLEKVKDLDPEINSEQLVEELGKDKQTGLKFGKTNDRLKDSRKMTTSFELNGHVHTVDLNSKDQEVYDEEQEIILQGERLKEVHNKNIKSIPAQEIIDNNFVRIRVGEKYILFKKLTKGSGVVIIK